MPSGRSGSNLHCAGRRSLVKWMVSLAVARKRWKRSRSHPYFIAVKMVIAAAYCIGGQWSRRGHLEHVAVGGGNFAGRTG